HYPSPGNTSNGGGAPFPLLNASGGLTGLCLPITNDPCFSLAGASGPTPPGLARVGPPDAPWDGTSISTGTRVYVPQGTFAGDAVACFDYSTGASCPQFPVSPPNLRLLYTINRDPQRPTCIWVNGDSGTTIQNFDAFSGQACGSGPIRVLA